MKPRILNTLLAIFCLATGLLAQAQQSIEGVWQGSLEIAPGNTINVLFTLTQEGGNWSAVLDSPNMGAIKNIPANSVSFDGSRLDIAVDALSGTYGGVLENGTFQGEWSQPGSTIAMTLEPFEAKVLSEEAIALLLGQWSGKLVAPGISFNIVFHFEHDEAGTFVGFIQNADAGPARQALANITLEGDEFFFNVPAANGAEYRGTLNGDAITGRLRQGPQDMELNVTKGALELAKPEVSAADIDMLLGQWHGKLKTPAAEMTIVFHFERDADGEFVAMLQNADAGANRIPVQDFKVENGAMSFRIPAMNGAYQGQIAGETITGGVTTGPSTMELNLVKGEYVPEIPTLALTAEDFATLAGSWSGQLGPITLVLRVERNDQGVIVAFVDSPTQGAMGLRVTSAALVGGKLDVALTVPPATYSGTLDGNVLTGNWNQGGTSSPLTLTKE
jgi:hypothetical protein